MRIEKKPLRDLKRAAYNPRKKLKEGDKEYEKIKRSLETFGQVEPLVWNERTGNLVGGHQRLTVMQDMGYTETDVAVVDLDEAQEKQLNVTLNKVKGRWDFDKLAELLGEMEDVTLTGFEQWEVDGLSTDYDHISDLLAEDFTDLKDPSEQTTFNMTFVLPLREKESIDNFIATEENAKEILADLVVQKAQGLL
jgi:ParB-like chromosome segregation protein Spo0J